MTKATFAERLLRWFDVHGRHDLPWQHPRDPYRVWLSEVMLQQTQVSTVIPYFERFLAHFPDVATLAAAPIDDVLQRWAGLGYYARARNLHRAAQDVMTLHGGVFPRDAGAISALPGVGRSTAGAILAQAFDLPYAILDGNVRRVLARHAGVEGWPGLPKVQNQLWVLAEALLPAHRLADYTQAFMDLGSTLCRARTPECTRCPVSTDCIAYRDDRITQLPAPKPKRMRPRKQSTLFVITRNSDEILLERRAPAGIWGGLWSLPLGEINQAWQERLQELGYVASQAQALASIDHAFTHFDLQLHPLRVELGQELNQVSESTSRTWIKLGHPETWPGLPAPIRKLLDRLSQQPELALSSLPKIPTPCPAPSTASSSTNPPKASTARPTRARSVSVSTTRSQKKPGRPGSSTRRG